MSTRPELSTPVPESAIHRLVPYAHVEDVEAPLAFYALLGFSTESLLRTPCGRLVWARVKSGGAELMFARASGPLDPGQQAVLFYMYCADIAGLRERLLQGGLHDGDEFHGQKGSPDGRRVVFKPVRRDYMPGGEMRVADPDGYVILVGQPG